MTESTGFESKVFALRRQFDHSFAVEPEKPTQDFEDLLTVNVAGDPYVLRAREVSGLFVGRRVVPVPTRRADLLGIAGIRSSIVPIYSLSTVLGYAATTTPAPWIVVCDDFEPLGLAFQNLDGFFRARKSDIFEASRSNAASPLIRHVARVSEATRPIVDIRLLLQLLKGQRREAAPNRGEVI